MTSSGWNFGISPFPGARCKWINWGVAHHIQKQFIGRHVAQTFINGGRGWRRNEIRYAAMVLIS